MLSNGTLWILIFGINRQFVGLKFFTLQVYMYILYLKYNRLYSRTADPSFSFHMITKNNLMSGSCWCMFADFV